VRVTLIAEKLPFYGKIFCKEEFYQEIGDLSSSKFLAKKLRPLQGLDITEF